MRRRLLSVLAAGPATGKVKHFHGAPPEVTGGEDAREEMGSAAYLVIETHPDGVFLYRYDQQGACVGDTWHMDIDDAKYQADYEYEASVRQWCCIPQEVEDVVAFGLNRLREASS